MAEQGASQELIEWSARRQNLIKGTAASMELQMRTWYKAAEVYFTVETGGGLLKWAGSKYVQAGRAAYESKVIGLNSIVRTMRDAGSDSEAIARVVHQMRRDIGVQFKNITPKTLREQIYARNLEKYGDKLGPSIEWLRSKGKSWDEIIDSATRPGGTDLPLKK